MTFRPAAVGHYVALNITADCCLSPTDRGRLPRLPQRTPHSVSRIGRNRPRLCENFFPRTSMGAG